MIHLVFFFLRDNPMDWTCNEVEKNGFMELELKRESRNLNGYTLLTIHGSSCLTKMSEVERTIFEMNHLSIEKENVIQDENVEMASIASVDSMSEFTKLQKLMSSLWKSLTLDLKNAWRNRAALLNDRPIDILFDKIPKCLITIGFENVLRRSLVLESSKLKRWLSNMLSRKPARGLSNKFMYIPFKTKIQNESWRRETVGYDMLLCLFGFNGKKVEEKIVKKTKTIVYVHVFSTEEMKSIFTIDGKCLIEVQSENSSLVPSSKVLLEKNGVRLFGYITKQEGPNVTIRLCNNKNVVLRSPVYSHGNYKMGSVEKGYTWVEFHPMGIRINENSMFNIKMNFSRVCYRNNGTINSHRSS